MHPIAGKGGARAAEEPLIGECGMKLGVGCVKLCFYAQNNTDLREPSKGRVVDNWAPMVLLEPGLVDTRP